MKLLLILVSLLNQGNTCPEGATPNVRISVVKQVRHHDLEDPLDPARTVIFRLVNESGRPVIIYGRRIDGPFIPSGYIMFLDEKAGEWKDRDPDREPAKKLEPASFMARRELAAGDYETAFAFFREAEVGMRFRWTGYAAFHAKDSPCEIRGKVFVLK